jgi:fused signal recognition particle receptor
MNSSTQDMMMYLVLFVGILVLAIAVPITISMLKKKKPETIIPQTQPLKNTEALAVEEKGVPEPVAVILEKEVTVSAALQKTEENFFGRIKKAFSLNSSEKKKVLDEIEEVLYTSDLGPKTVVRLMDKVSDDLSKSEMMDLGKIKNALESEMNLILSTVHESQKNSKTVMDLISKSVSGPTVLMVVGVNGAGKTTSIGKITAQLASLNQKVLVAAGDTFRAAAGGQLKVWTDRANEKSTESLVEIFWPENTTDPAAVAFDAVSKAKAKNFDYVILDTAGRLHTQSNLMDELKKVKRVMTKVIPEAPHETWIVLDANSGQNALSQAVEFNKALEISGVVLTKMDGTAKGGVALGVVDQLQKPIKLIGIGEKISDLRIFNQVEYVQSILGKN